MARLELIPMGEVSWLAANGWRMKAARRRCEPDAPMKSGIGVGMSGTWSDAPTDPVRCPRPVDCRRRRHQPRRPALAKIRPASPAPAMIARVFRVSFLGS